MRDFLDPDGRRWQAAPLYASYGQMLLVFSAMEGGAILHQPMAADTLAQAEDELAQLDDGALRTLLQQAQPWDYDAKKF
ncbi:MAG: hypothetical protein ABS45_04765 [Comamonas sp. SCN 65-56]|uniref:hypothetical protein n=1 Tax=Comamonas sp. SCN 65-56 TaxID=1660095 RepID=UPI00086E7826|nr:hypothetical protein [Comamonas sp. SCN 65-56]ODS92922.1 MAG: hypothetical protein ABS45_04765 [Comamonas sp. SCN 65-56]